MSNPKKTATAVQLGKSLGPLVRPLNRLAVMRPGLFLTGGAVRDALLRRPVHDVDITVTKGSSVTAARMFADATGGALVILGQKRLARVYLKAATVDFTPLRARTLELDLRRRDFTVNAMAVQIPWGSQPALVDPLGGQGDLRARRLKLCGPRVFREDPVRLWRAHRAVLELGLRMDPTTKRRLHVDARRAKTCPAERLRDELFKLLAHSRSAQALHAAMKSGVLEATFPQLVPMRRVRVPRGGVIDVLAHTIEALEHLDRVLARIRTTHPRECVEMAAHFALEPVRGRSRIALVKLALLFHDIAKPETITRNAQGEMHFYGHETVGARKATTLLRQRLKCGEAEVDIITRIIKHHLRPGYLAAAPGFTDRAAYKLLRDVGEELFELIVHSEADRQAHHHEYVVTAVQERRAITRVLALRRAMRSRVLVKRLVTGHDLMRAWGLKPGPIIGEMLRAVDEGVALGQIRTKPEAVRAAKAILDQSKG